MARDICNLFGLNADDYITFVENRPFNDQRYYLDDAKLTKLGWSERTSWEDGLKKTLEWYSNNADYWGDVSGALLPHPRMLANAASGAFIPTTQLIKENSLPPKVEPKEPVPSKFKFLIYGRSGWIGGLLGKLCEEQGIPYEYGTARLEDRAAIEADIAAVKPTQVLNAAGVTGRPNVDWCETNRVETIRANVIGALNLADVTKWVCSLCFLGVVHCS